MSFLLLGKMDAKYEGLKQTAWKTFVFNQTPQTEVGYGRLCCECKNLGEFLEAYTKDLGNEEENADEDVQSKKPRVELSREAQDAQWRAKLVNRPNTPFIYQLPHLQTQTVCYGLTNLRCELLSAFQRAAAMFDYACPIFSGSRPSVLNDFTSPRHDDTSCIPHGMTKNLDSFSWTHYKPPMHESVCVSWHHLKVELFNDIPMGHAAGETFGGEETKKCQAKLAKISNWRCVLALASSMSMKSELNLQNVIDVAHVFRATYPLKLVYVNDAGKLRHARQLEVCRAALMNVDIQAAYPSNDDADDDDVNELEEFDCETEQDASMLDIENRELKTLWQDSIAFLATGGGAKKMSNKCELCPFSEDVQETQFTSVDDYIASKYKHMSEAHGPLGANFALENAPDWIQKYVWHEQDQEPIKKFCQPLWDAGFRKCGYFEQKTWKNLPASEEFLTELSINQ
jgi:hypothetical protein